MTLSLLFVLSFASIISMFLKWSKLAYALIFLTLGYFLLIGTGFIPSILLNHLESHPSNNQPNWQPKNDINLLGGGLTKEPLNSNILPSLFSFSRIFVAAKLYYSCKKSGNKCMIIISGGDKNRIGISEAELYKSELQKIEVANSDILLETTSANTIQNARFTSEILQHEHFDAIYLVTSAIHLKRAALYFFHFGIFAIPEPSDYISSQTSLLPLAYNFLITDLALHEYAGIIRFHIYEFFGWNKS